MQLCVEYRCHVRDGAPNYYLEMLDKLPKRVHRSVGHTFALTFEPSTDHQNVAAYVSYIVTVINNDFIITSI